MAEPVAERLEVGPDGLTERSGSIDERAFDCGSPGAVASGLLAPDAGSPSASTKPADALAAIRPGISGRIMDPTKRRARSGLTGGSDRTADPTEEREWKFRRR